MFPNRIVIAVALAALIVAPAAFAGSPRSGSSSSTEKGSTHLTASCAGDTITGTISLSGPATETYRLDLSYRPRGRSGWSATGRSASFRGDGTRHAYPFSFDVSPFDAFAYRLDLAGESVQSQTIPTASCAPGRQVPEAPIAILLPLSLLATSGLLFGRRNRL